MRRRGPGLVGGLLIGGLVAGATVAAMNTGQRTQRQQQARVVKQNQIKPYCPCGCIMIQGKIQQGTPTCGNLNCRKNLTNSICYYCPNGGKVSMHRKGFFYCKQCAYNVCPKSKTCPGAHGLHAFKVPKNYYKCDSCKRNNFGKGHVMYGCRKCNYDLCITCYQKPIQKAIVVQQNTQSPQIAHTKRVIYPSQQPQPMIAHKKRVKSNKKQAPQGPHVIKQGWISKKGSWNTAFKKRWFKLYSNRKMAYLTEPNASFTKGYVDLTTLKKMERKGHNGMELVTQERTWSFQCKSQTQRDQWFTIIESLCFAARKPHQSKAVQPHMPIVNSNVEQKVNKGMQQPGAMGYDAGSMYNVAPKKKINYDNGSMYPDLNQTQNIKHQIVKQPPPHMNNNNNAMEPAAAFAPSAPPIEGGDDYAPSAPPEYQQEGSVFTGQ